MSVKSPAGLAKGALSRLLAPTGKAPAPAQFDDPEEDTARQDEAME